MARQHHEQQQDTDHEETEFSIVRQTAEAAQTLNSCCFFSSAKNYISEYYDLRFIFFREALTPLYVILYKPVTNALITVFLRQLLTSCWSIISGISSF